MLSSHDVEKGLRPDVKLNRREANLFGFFIHAEKERRLTAVDVDPHHHSVPDSFYDNDLVAANDAVIASRPPIFLKLSDVIEFVLIGMLIRVRCVVPATVVLSKILPFYRVQKLVYPVLGR